MYTLNDAKYDCLKEFQYLGLDTPSPLWLDFIIKLIVEDFFKQNFILDGKLKDVGLKIKDDGEIPINDKFARDLIINAVLGVYYADIDEIQTNRYAYKMMEVAEDYNKYLLSEGDNTNE